MGATGLVAAVALGVGLLLAVGGLTLLWTAGRRRRPALSEPADLASPTAVTQPRWRLLPFNENWVQARAAASERATTTPRWVVLLAGGGCGALGVALLVLAGGTLVQQWLVAPAAPTSPNTPEADRTWWDPDGEGSDPNRPERTQPPTAAAIELPTRVGGLGRREDNGDFSRFKDSLWTWWTQVPGATGARYESGEGQQRTTFELTALALPDSAWTRPEVVFDQVRAYEVRRLSMNGRYRLTSPPVPFQGVRKIHCFELRREGAAPAGRDSLCVWLEGRVVGALAGLGTDQERVLRALPQARSGLRPT